MDVITGLIKANFPARVSFRVASKVDSRTILDANGCGIALGRGDKVVSARRGSARLNRMHGPFVTEDEITVVRDHWRSRGKGGNHVPTARAPKDEMRRAQMANRAARMLDDDLYQEAGPSGLRSRPCLHFNFAAPFAKQAIGPWGLA